MDEQMKHVLNCALILFFITAVVAAILAGVNSLTKDVIEQNAAKTEQEALSAVMPQAQTFAAYDAEAATAYDVAAIYMATGADGTIKGYCIKLSQNGYGGAIEAVVGVGMDKTVTGVSIISHSETPGLGANVEKESFRAQYVGQGAVTVVKAGAKPGEVNAVSGATISSKALTTGVNKAVEVTERLLRGDIVQTDKNTDGKGAALDE